MSEQAKPKIPPRRVMSDDCAIRVGRVVRDNEVVEEGEAHYVHAGEWVELIPIRSVGEMIALADLKHTAVTGDEQAGEAAIKTLCERLSQRVIAWNWTDLMGRELPAPFGNPDVFHDLTDDELTWLLSQLGEGSEARKNGSAPLATTSSAGAPSRRKRS